MTSRAHGPPRGESLVARLPSMARELVGAAVLVVDQDEKVHAGMAQLLGAASLHVTSARDPEAAMAQVERQFFSVVLIDLVEHPTHEGKPALWSMLTQDARQPAGGVRRVFGRSEESAFQDRGPGNPRLDQGAVQQPLAEADEDPVGRIAIEGRPLGHTGLADVERHARISLAAVPVAPVALEVAQPHRQLVDGRLNLLQAEDIGLFAIEEILDLRLAGADAVDVPRRDFHPPIVNRPPAGA